MEAIDMSLVDWSRYQFALTALYHWIFVPLTLGLGLIVAIMETIYVRTGDEFWKRTVKYWMKLFAINFAIGVATGIILEFQFGTNWSNYSWFVGDIFGAPLAIEGIMAFFMEATFFAVMFFGWDKVSKRAHLASTWLVAIGATLSALWILVANAWMQAPTGMHFNPETVRNEMTSFMDVVSEVALTKFSHAVTSSWMLGAVFVVGVSCWYLWKKRETRMALSSIRVASWVGLAGIVLAIYTGHMSGRYVAKHQPMKLAAMEALYEGGRDVPVIVVGLLNPGKKSYKDVSVSPYIFTFDIPGMLSWLAYGSTKAEVRGINQIIAGGPMTYPGQGTVIEPSTIEMIEMGKKSIAALGDYREAMAKGDTAAMAESRIVLEKYFPYFGYGYLDHPQETIPPIGLTFYSFRLMVGFGFAFLGFFLVYLIWSMRESFLRQRWLFFIGVCCIPVAYITSFSGWIVTEVGRQPWVIQNLLPTRAAVSAVSTGTVQTTFFIFVAIFTTLFIAELGIMLRAINKGPENAPAAE
ncbi:MAG: cytochrome ubiquinol oxidase subunit I [Bacteroidales bacterium]|nr:cytochrome ubiquinol oxidase subunit I [Bacteroidales bacterium]